MFAVLNMNAARAMPSMFRTTRVMALLAACFTASTFADTGKSIVVRDAWSRATPPGIAVGVAYLTIQNQSPPDRLLGAASPIAKKTELHESTMDGGIMKMQAMVSVPVGQNATVRFEPGGKHLMLLGLQQPLKAGDSFPLTLNFEKSGSVKTTVRVFGIGQSPDSKR